MFSFPQVSSHLTALYSHPNSQEQCSHNALVLMDALTNIGITYDCQVRKKAMSAGIV